MWWRRKIERKKKFGRFREKRKSCRQWIFFFLLQSKPAGCEPLFILLSNIDVLFLLNRATLISPQHCYLWWGHKHYNIKKMINFFSSSLKSIQFFFSKDLMWGKIFRLFCFHSFLFTWVENNLWQYNMMYHKTKLWRK